MFRRNEISLLLIHKYYTRYILEKNVQTYLIKCQKMTLCIICCQIDTENYTQPEEKYTYDGRRLPMYTFEEIMLNETRGKAYVSVIIYTVTLQCFRCIRNVVCRESCRLNVGEVHTHYEG